jgi:hypothetical protein
MAGSANLAEVLLDLAAEDEPIDPGAWHRSRTASLGRVRAARSDDHAHLRGTSMPRDHARQVRRISPISVRKDIVMIANRREMG